MRLSLRVIAFAFAAALCAGAAGCGANPPAGTAAQNATPAQGQEKRYALKGTIVMIDRPQKHLLIDHEAIPDFMAAMTMPYPVVDDATLDRVMPGDQITADVVVYGDPPMLRLENVVVVKKADGAAKTPSGATIPHSLEGDTVPDFAFVNQDGAQFGLRKYAGKAMLVTFIYTRCPLADFCPLVSHNFAEIEKTLAKNPSLYAKTHLLCISFDPKFDTPPVLRAFGLRYAPDKGKQTFSHFEFASVTEAEKKNVLEFFNVFASEQQGQINHSLRTAVITPGGKVFRSYNDSEWKPADLIADLNMLFASQAG